MDIIVELIKICSSNTLPFVLIVLFLISSFALAKLKKQRKQLRLPPGPWKLPVIGSLHHVLGELPHRSLTRLSRKYGPLMHLQLGEVPAIVASSPEMAKAVTKTHDLAFADRPKLAAVDLVFYKCTDVAFSPYGDYWREMRRICIVELLTTKMVKSFGSIRRDELQKMVSSIRDDVAAAAPVNVMDKVIWFNSSMTCRAAFGRICRDQEKLIGMVREVLTFAGGFDVADMFPSKKWIPRVTGTGSRLIKMHRGLDEIYESIIEEHEENQPQQRDGCEGNNDDDDTGREDIVDVLLRLKGEDGDARRQYRLTRDNIKAVINDLFSAGSETTATTATWAMSEMMLNPSVMVRAQEEVRKSLEGKTARQFEDGDLEELTYLRLVVRETLRMHPPIPLLLPRECREETTMGGYVIPAKTRVIVNAWAIGRDPDTWKYPDCFWPERFLNHHDADVHGNHFGLIPFGAGRRMCPGVGFGLANVMHSLAVLLYHFDWELPSGATPQNFDMREMMGLKATRKNDLCLVAKPFTHTPSIIT